MGKSQSWSVSWLKCAVMIITLSIVLLGCMDSRDSDAEGNFSQEQTANEERVTHKDELDQFEKGKLDTLTSEVDSKEKQTDVQNKDVSLQHKSETENALTEEKEKENEKKNALENNNESNNERKTESENEQAALVEKKRKLPEGFVYVDEVLQHADYDIRYYGEHNFIGAPVTGYNSPLAILSEPAAEALRIAEQELAALGYALLIYDAYRPTKAVEHFISWAQDEHDTAMKEEFYPDIEKENVFKLGYLSKRSGHSRGSTVDLTLIDQESREPLDMGGDYDVLGDISAHDAKGLTEEQARNRLLLKETMIAAGFKPYHKEWWHYTLKKEPYPAQYFDFDVE